MAEPSLCAPLEPASILKAHTKISPYLVCTPLLTSLKINEIVSHENPRAVLARQKEGNGDGLLAPVVVRYSPQIKLYFKCENLQRTGAFKARGAFNAVCSLIEKIGIEALKEKGVATVSSGNHAQGLALAASTMGVPAAIVMPETSAPSKIKGVMSHLDIDELNDEGGKSAKGRIVFCGPSNAEKKAAAAEVVDTTGAVFVPPYDHPDIILGQGTCATEMQQQCEGLGEGPLDAVLAPIGGGGLLGGIATWFSDKETRVFGAEPAFEGADDASRGLKARQRIAEVSSSTIADGLRTPVGLLNWEIVSDSKKVHGIFAVSEEEITMAMRLIIEELKVVVEPSACVPLAVVLFNEDFRRLVVEQQGDESWNLGIVLSGGNTTLEAINFLFHGS